MPFFLIMAVVIAIVAVLFALQNARLVTISFLMFETESSLALVLLLTFAIGSLLGILVLTPRLIKSKMALSQQKKQIQGLEKSLQHAINKTADPQAPRAVNDAGNAQGDTQRREPGSD